MNPCYVNFEAMRVNKFFTAFIARKLQLELIREVDFLVVLQDLPLSKFFPTLRANEARFVRPVFQMKMFVKGNFSFVGNVALGATVLVVFLQVFRFMGHQTFPCTQNCSAPT
jgi:hypothetical protein